jgi:DNA-binding XRE family transcriptional regulator
VDKAKAERLKNAGWRVGSAQEFLELSKEEAAFVEMKLALAIGLRKRRQRRRMTQHQLAQILGSSQSRVAKMEAADPSVSVDLLIQALLRMGTTPRELAKLIGSGRRSRAA